MILENLIQNEPFIIIVYKYKIILIYCLFYIFKGFNTY